MSRVPRGKKKSSASAARKKHGRRLEPGDLVLPLEKFDDSAFDWVPYEGVALVIEMWSPPLYPGPSTTVAYVLIDGRVVDDYYEDELTLL